MHGDINYSMFKDATISYIKTTNKKQRLITTYTKNDLGRKLRIKHKVDLNYINHFLKNDELSFAYQKKKNTKMMVKKHLKNDYFLYVDIKSFFNNINLDILKEKASYLASEHFPTDKIYDLIDSCKISDNKGIAIGLIPSAFFSNIYLEDFDQEFNEILKNIDINFEYSRYSDDIVISNNQAFDYHTIIDKLTHELKKLDLEIHQTKSRYKTLEKHSDHIKILGLNIVKGHDSNYITVSRKFKNITRHEKNVFKKQGMKNYIYQNEN